MQTGTVVLFTRAGMGHTDDAELQQILAGGWLRMAMETEQMPSAIAFYTDGVRLACEGSAVLDELQQMADRGVQLILCKTCLDRFGLTDKVKVGTIGGMRAILEAQAKASKLINL